jgi:sulfite reductase beta subunit-like hemoprotein|tara:strand:+ start:38 stop:247 length:210 start_codon:yes stop_codon:yes gene_type:complete
MSSIHPMQGRNANISASITKLTDSTGGTASDTCNDTTSDTKDDLASLIAKVNAILDALEAYGITDASGN